jgi:NADH-quinone oxidoreductase subunit M
MSGWPILASLQLLPLLAAALVWRLRDSGGAIVVARIAAAAELALALKLLAGMNPAVAVFQHVEQVSVGGMMLYHAGADGLTALFVLLAAFLSFMLTLYGLVRGLASAGRLSAAILAAEGMLMVMLTTLNLGWFAAASLAELSCVAYLIGRWSTSTEENRTLAMTRFVQFQATGLVMFAAGVVILAWGHADAVGYWSFDLFDLRRAPLQGKFESAAFFLMFYGLAVRTPLFPLHGWLPLVAHRGTVSVAPALLLGIKVGIYGMLRFVLPLTPQAVVEWQPYVVGFAMAGVFYAAILALLQDNLRRLLAFAVVSHTGLIVVGLFTLTAEGMQGAALLAVNFGLAATAMLFMVGLVFRRTRTTDLGRLGGLFERIPFIAVVFLIGGLSIVGMPGTPGFDAAHLVLEAAIHRFGALPAVATALGNVAAAGFLLWAFQRAFLAPRATGEGGAIERTRPMEYLVGALIVAVLLWAGFRVEPWLELTDATLRALAARFPQP